MGIGTSREKGPLTFFILKKKIEAFGAQLWDLKHFVPPVLLDPDCRQEKSLKPIWTVSL